MPSPLQWSQWSDILFSKGVISFFFFLFFFVFVCLFVSLRQSFIFVDMNGVYFPNYKYVFFFQQGCIFFLCMLVLSEESRFFDKPSWLLH